MLYILCYTILYTYVLQVMELKHLMHHASVGGGGGNYSVSSRIMKFRQTVSVHQVPPALLDTADPTTANTNTTGTTLTTTTVIAGSESEVQGTGIGIAILPVIEEGDESHHHEGEAVI